MVVKPPGDPRRTRILEIHNGVFAAVKHMFFERVRGAMRHAGKAKLGLGVHAFAVKSGKKGGGGGAVETAIVKEDPRYKRVGQIILTGLGGSGSYETLVQSRKASNDVRGWSYCQAKRPGPAARRTYCKLDLL